MKVLHVIPSVSKVHGGPSVALPLIARSLASAGVRVDVATTDDDGHGKRLDVPPGERVDQAGWGIFYFRKQTEFYKYSAPLSRWLKGHAARYDIIHIHALFSWSSTCAARHARQAKVPYIIRPLGVLNRWGMENRRRFLKRLSFRYVEQPALRQAAAIHYTSFAEQREAEGAGVIATPAIIPIGIDTGAFASLPGPETFLARYPQARGRNIILFLSRLDPKKGLDLLLPAFATLRQKHRDALLVLAGSGEPAFVEQLKVMSRDLGIADVVLWPGFVAGLDKLALFAATTVFVLPSYSENFGIALVEALAAGLPCVTTDGVAVSADVRAHRAGVVVGTDPESLDRGLDEMLRDKNLRESCGSNARILANEHYSMASMGTALMRLYSHAIQE